MKIAFTGAQSTGKTTLCDLVKSKYDRFNSVYHYADYNNGLIKKDMIENMDKNLMELIFLHFHEVSMFLNPVEWCAERAPLDVLAYTIYDYRKGLILGDTVKYVAHKAFLLTNQLDYLFWLRPEFEIEDNGIRNTNAIYQKEIDDIFVEILADERLQVPVARLTGSIEERMLQLSSYL